MILAIGQFALVLLGVIALPFLGTNGSVSITTIVSELFGALFGLTQFFDFKFIKNKSLAKTICWVVFIADVIAHIYLNYQKGIHLALFTVFIGFGFGVLLDWFTFLLIQKTGETVSDAADTAHTVRVNLSPTVIFYCSSCNKTYSDKSAEKASCPKCGKPMINTKIKVEKWREYSSEQKEEIKAQLQSEQARVSQERPFVEEKPCVQNEQQAEKNEANSSKKTFCRKCGAQIPADSAFCPKCGEKVIDI